MRIPLDDISKDKNFINAIKYTVRLQKRSTYSVDIFFSGHTEVIIRSSLTSRPADLVTRRLHDQVHLVTWEIMDSWWSNVKLVIDLDTEKSTLIIEASCQTDSNGIKPNQSQGWKRVERIENIKSYHHEIH